MRSFSSLASLCPRIHTLQWVSCSCLCLSYQEFASCLRGLCYDLRTLRISQFPTCAGSTYVQNLKAEMVSCPRVRLVVSSPSAQYLFFTIFINLISLVRCGPGLRAFSLRPAASKFLFIS